MSDEQRAERMRALSERLIDIITAFDNAETDIEIMTGALGICCGVLATVTGSPEKFMLQVNAVAKGIISGELVE